MFVRKYLESSLGDILGNNGFHQFQPLEKNVYLPVYIQYIISRQVELEFCPSWIEVPLFLGQDQFFQKNFEHLQEDGVLHSLSMFALTLLLREHPNSSIFFNKRWQMKYQFMDFSDNISFWEEPGKCSSKIIT